MKRSCDNRSKATNEDIEEVYYATVGSKHDDKPEIEEAYYTTVRSKHDDKREATNEIDREEAYYATVKSKYNDKPEASNEIEEAYYTAMKGICNDGSREIKGQEVYYSTIDISTCAVDPQTLDMEMNCSYGDIRMHMNH